MAKLITPADFRSLAEAGSLPERPALRRSSTIAPEMSNGRIIRYNFSDPGVARDGNTIAADAWVLAPFMENPVFLWAHAYDMLPVGRVVDLETVGQTLKGNVEYAEHPFADTVYQMVKAGYLNATSVGFIPLKWKFPVDKARIFGVDFTSVELLEISQVPVPALPTALIDARSAGIDTQPIVEWAERLLDTGDTVLIPRPELEALRRAAKMPKSARSKPKLPIVRASITTVQRGLYSVAELAYLLLQLGYLEDEVEWEAEYEGDGSDIPARLTDALRMLGQILVDMTAEEVAELIGDENGDEPMMIGAVEMATKTPKQRALILIGRLARAVPAEVTPLETMTLRATPEIVAQLTRAGRVLSSSNEATLREAHDHMTRACEMVRGVVDQVTLDDEEEGEDPALIEMAATKARARASAEVDLLRLAAA